MYVYVHVQNYIADRARVIDQLCAGRSTRAIYCSLMMRLLSIKLLFLICQQPFGTKSLYISVLCYCFHLVCCIDLVQAYILFHSQFDCQISQNWI